MKYQFINEINTLNEYSFIWDLILKSGKKTCSIWGIGHIVLLAFNRSIVESCHLQRTNRTHRIKTLFKIPIVLFVFCYFIIYSTYLVL